jgi:hypothetical protein
LSKHKGESKLGGRLCGRQGPPIPPRA